MFYEVFIPASEADGFDLTITVEADNWMMALKSGLQRTGEGSPDIRNVMCDIKEDNSIHVTDALTRRVFVLKELGVDIPEEDPAPSTHAAIPEATPPEPTPAPTPEPEPAPIAAATVPVEAVAAAPPPVVAASPAPTPTPAPAAEAPAARSYTSGEQPWLSQDGRVRIGSSNFEAQRREQEPASRVVQETRRRSGSRPALQLPSANVSENILEDIFLDIQSLHERSMEMEDAINFVLDMAMNKIPAESGAILFADVNGSELYFAAARGPKAKAVLDFRVPIAQGIVGFCVREGVSIAISDAPRDARFYRKISDLLSYPNRNLVCVPIQFEGRVYGCVELLNRKDGSQFNLNEINALTYIGNQFGQYVNNLIMGREPI